jgi:hypothetical protein
MFEQERAIVLEPLEFAGRPVGVGAFTWGAHEPIHYEMLREVLGPALLSAGTRAAIGGSP